MVISRIDRLCFRQKNVVAVTQAKQAARNGSVYLGDTLIR